MSRSDQEPISSQGGYGSDKESEGNEGNGGILGFFGSIVPSGGFLATIFSTAATVIGAGLFGMPSSFNDTGMAMSIIYLLLVSLGNIYTMRLLAKLSDKTGLQSMDELSNLYLNTLATIILGILRFLFCFGCCVAYVISVGNVLSSIITNSEHVPAFLLTDWGLKVLQIAYWAVILMPVVIPRQVNSLRYVSAVGVIFILFLVGVIVAHGIMNGLKQHPRPEVRAFGTGNPALNGIGTFIFAFTNQFNCLDVYREMNPKTKSLKNYTICCIISIFLCCWFYILGGMFGYFDFGPAASSSLLVLYDPISEPQILIAYIGVLIKLSSSYALLFAGARNAIYEFFGWDYFTIAFWKHLLIVCIIAVLVLICGLFIPNINTVFGFVGGFCGGGVSFLFPVYLTMYAGNWNIKSVGLPNYLATYFTLAAGVFAVVVGTATTIFNAV